MKKKGQLGHRDHNRLAEAVQAMDRLRATFKQGDNRHGEYGRNVKAAFERHAKVYAEITGQNPPSIYD